MKYYVRLEKGEAEIFEQKLDHLTGKSFPMGTEQDLLKKERKEGTAEGIKKGIEKGAFLKTIKWF
ncbi:MAG: hypothetical protein IPN86_14650 [Saprospiraceae bacterium]|nr:hypothetical protein [Saprospiraceae bacterium]